MLLKFIEISSIYEESSKKLIYIEDILEYYNNFIELISESLD